MSCEYCAKLENTSIVIQRVSTESETVLDWQMHFQGRTHNSDQHMMSNNITSSYSQGIGENVFEQVRFSGPKKT